MATKKKQKVLLKIELKRVMGAKELLSKLLEADLNKEVRETYREAIFALQIHEDELIDEIEMF